MSNINNFNTKKYTNLSEYLKLDKPIDKDNVDEILSNFIVEDHFYKNDDYCAICFCGHSLKNYYYIYNINNGDRLFCGNSCVCIFDKCNRLENGKVNKKLQKALIDKLNSGSFEEITNWDLYLEMCLIQYINDIEKYQFNRLLEINKHNATLTDLLNKFWDERNKKEKVEMLRLQKIEEDKHKQIELEKKRNIEKAEYIREVKRNTEKTKLENIRLEKEKLNYKYTKKNFKTLSKDFNDAINAKIEYYRKLEENLI